MRKLFCVMLTALAVLCPVLACGVSFAAGPAVVLREVTYEDGLPVPDLAAVEPYRLITFSYEVQGAGGALSYDLSIRTNEGNGSYSGPVTGTPPTIAHSISLKPLESGAIEVRAFENGVPGEILYSRFSARDGVKPAPGEPIITLSGKDLTVDVGETFTLTASLSRALASAERLDWDVHNNLMEILDIAPDGRRVSLRAAAAGRGYVSVSLVDADHGDEVLEAHLCLVTVRDASDPGNTGEDGASGSGGGCNAAIAGFASLGLAVACATRRRNS